MGEDQRGEVMRMMAGEFISSGQLLRKAIPRRRTCCLNRNTPDFC